MPRWQTGTTLRVESYLHRAATRSWRCRSARRKGDHIIAQLRTLLIPSPAAVIVPEIGPAGTNETSTDCPVGRVRRDDESMRLAFKQFETPLRVPYGGIDSALAKGDYGSALLPGDGDDVLVVTTQLTLLGVLKNGR